MFKVSTQGHAGPQAPAAAHRARGHPRHRVPGRHLRVHRHDPAAPSTTCSPTSTRTPTPTSARRTSIEGDFGPSSATAHPRLASSPRSQAVPGVDRGRGRRQGFARIIGKDGKALGSGADGAAHLRRRSSTPGEPVAVDHRRRRGARRADAGRASTRAAFKDGDFAVGDTVKIAGQGGSREFTLVGHRPLRRRRLARRRHVRPVRPADGAGVRRPSPASIDAVLGRRATARSATPSWPQRIQTALAERRDRGAHRRGDHRGEPDRHPDRACSSSPSS